MIKSQLPLVEYFGELEYVKGTQKVNKVIERGEF